METRVNRTAPLRFALGAADVDPSALPLWRGLMGAFVPVAGLGLMYDVVTRLRSDSPPSTTLRPGRSEASGRALGLVGTGILNGTNGAQGLRVPQTGPFSVFAFLVRRDASATHQQLFGNGEPGKGWNLKLNHTGGQIGMIRWGIADYPTTTLGAVPTAVPVAVSLSFDGTNARFMLNGKFQTLAIGGNPTAPTNKWANIGLAATATEPLQNASIHCVYCWSRLLADAEALRLMRDPWFPVRPAQRWMIQGAGGGGPGGSGARVFVPAFIG